MARAFKYLHVIATTGLIGSLAVLAALALRDGSIITADAAVPPRVTSWIFTRVTLPSVVMLWIAGLLSLAVRPAWLETGWVWAKLILGFAMTGMLYIALWRALETPGAQVLSWSGATIALALAGAAFGVWRPRLRARRSPVP